MAKMRRNCVSMRDEVYIALKLYTDSLNEGRTEKTSVTGLCSLILVGEIPPIPQSIFLQAREVAGISREKREGLAEEVKNTRAVLAESIEEQSGNATELTSVKDDEEKVYGGIVSF